MITLKPITNGLIHVLTLTLNHLLEEINKIRFKQVHLDGPLK